MGDKSPRNKEKMKKKSAKKSKAHVHAQVSSPSEEVSNLK